MREFRLPCAPAAGGVAGGGVCAEERGIFYPGTACWVSVPYAGVGRRATVRCGRRSWPVGWFGRLGVRGSVGLCGFGGEVEAGGVS